jgi:hypothetical protein
MAVQTYEKGSVITLAGKWTGPLTEVFLEVRGPSSAAAVLYKLSLNQIDDDGGGDYHKDIIGDAAGPWFYRYSDENGERTIEGTFLVDENQTLIPAVTDARDVRTLIPRVRRALDGPAATSPLADASTLTDDEVTAVIADAIADILLYTGGSTVFGHTLEVVATITNERQTWTYKLSAQLLTNQFQMLTKARDAALEEVKVQHAVPEAYVSFLGARDASVAALIEPWINPENLNWSTSELSMPVGWHSGEIPSGFSY